jgi:hypothetical protein
MNRKFVLIILFALVMIIAVLALDYVNRPAPGQIGPIPTLPPAQLGDLNIVTGQMVFVPAYSEIAWVSASNTLELTATLAIHNTDPDDSIIIRSARYYDTAGNLVRDFVQAPVELPPLATTGFVIPAGESEGGWGTNFLVEWGAETAVYEPVIEAVMVSQRGAEGVSFISPGRVVSEAMP